MNIERGWSRSGRPGSRGCHLGPQAYEITFTGQADGALRAEFDDCEVTIGPGTTTLHAELPDQPALTGLMQRISGLGLEVIDVHRVDR